MSAALQLPSIWGTGSSLEDVGGETRSTESAERIGGGERAGE